MIGQVAMQTTDIVRETNEMVEDACRDGNTENGTNFVKDSSADLPSLSDLELEPDEMEAFNISASSWQQDEVLVHVLHCLFGLAKLSLKRRTSGVHDRIIPLQSLIKLQISIVSQQWQ